MGIMFNAQTIRDMRLGLGLTLAEFAGKIGVSESTISLWESGKRFPRYKALVKINELAESNLEPVPPPESNRRGPHRSAG